MAINAMQMYFMVRGHKMWQERFIQELNCNYLPFLFKDPNHPDYPNNPFEQRMIELMVRPIELYEVVFPKEMYDIVMTTILGSDKTAGAAAYPSDIMPLAQLALRKALGAKDFPDWKTDKALPVVKNGLSIMGIGIREDVEREYGEAL